MASCLVEEVKNIDHLGRSSTMEAEMELILAVVRGGPVSFREIRRQLYRHDSESRATVTHQCLGLLIQAGTVRQSGAGEYQLNRSL